MVRSYEEIIAQWISNVISPHVVGVVITCVVSLQYSHDPLNVFLWLLLLMPLLVIPPLSYLMWLVRNGVLEDIYMPTRHTRVRPLAILLGWLLFCLGLIRFLAAPQIVEAFLLITIVLIGILSLVTLFWKISFHGATISAAATATVLLVGSVAWPVLLLVPLVGWSRVRLARHTPRQVFFGSVVGVLVAWLVAQGLLINLL